MSIMLFNKWSTEGIKVEDKALEAYIGLDPRYVPKTGARYAGHKFHKSRISIVERLINHVMVPGHKGDKHTRSSGHITGMAVQAYETVKKALEIVERDTKLNPVMVLAKAVENAAPREEVVSIEYGGARYPKAVDCSPQRRIDIVLRYFVQGAYTKSFNTKKHIANMLAEEIVMAYNLDQRSLAVGKKQELERQAESSR